MSNLPEHLQLVLNIFYNAKQQQQKKLNITVQSHKVDSDINLSITINSKVYNYSYDFATLNDVKKYEKVALYRALSQFTKKKYPWGSLTGVRPTKLFDDLATNLSLDTAKNIFKDYYMVSDKKINVCQTVISSQPNKSTKEKDIHLYVHIPFCPSKCTYCSFVSYAPKNYQQALDQYLDALIKDIQQTVKFIKLHKYNLRSIYVGGGTPSILNEAQLTRLLSVFPSAPEFTYESGRVDTLDNLKFDIMRAYGVTRVCINPQSFNPKVLNSVNRPFDLSKLLQQINYAMSIGLIVNMDFIAGLKYESYSSFKKGLNLAISLKPHNITVHTLAIKNASDLKQNTYHKNADKKVAKMVDYAYQRLMECGYHPYYLYRQKRMTSNLENVGYSLSGYESVFNIDTMEDNASVIACGSGGISKRLFRKTNKIERYAIVKDIKQYILKTDEIIEKKLNLFK